MTISITREQLVEWGPCDVEARLKLFGRRKTLNVVQALAAGASIDNVLWVAGKLDRKDLCVRFAIRCAERVAALNPDPRVAAAIAAAERWLDDPSDETQAAAEAAARSAAAATAWSAAAARSAAAAAAEAAAVAVAARSAEAAAAAARLAEAAAAATAWSAAAAEAEAQKKILIELFQ